MIKFKKLKVGEYYFIVKDDACCVYKIIRHPEPNYFCVISIFNAFGGKEVKAGVEYVLYEDDYKTHEAYIKNEHINLNNIKYIEIYKKIFGFI